MAKKYDAGVKDYRETYWMPDYEPSATDLLACFKIGESFDIAIKPVSDFCDTGFLGRHEELGVSWLQRSGTRPQMTAPPQAMI